MGILKKIVYKLAGTSEELERIYQEKGYCDEWVDCYRKLHPKPQMMDKITLADVLITLERYHEAEEVLNSIKVTILSDDDTKGMYCLEMLNLYVNTGRTDKAMELIQKERKFLDIYFSSPPRARMAGAYYDNAAVIYASMGNTAEAGRFFQLEKQWAEKYDETGILIKITSIHLHDLLGNREEADKEAEAARLYIESYGGYKFGWQKQYFLKMLSRVYSS